MLESSIGWVLVVSGVVTAGGGLAAMLFPAALLRLVFGAGDCGRSTTFFVRHWGVLIFTIGALIAYGAYAPMVRPAVLTAAAIEKIAIVALIFFGPLKRTAGMTAVAAIDGAFAAIYVAYLAGL
jgi:hypothetical protein